MEDVSASYYSNVSDAINHFGLYSIEFGNWLNQEERLNFLYATLVTLRDMAKVVGLNHSQMGLHKKLSLAFGSRGKGGRTMAFYQPSVKVINLTKTKGRGTFCHEYGHAVDDLLGWHSGGRSARKQPDYNGKRKDSAAWLFEVVMDKVLWNENGSPSSYQNYLEGKGHYLNQRAEIFARICETYFLMKFKSSGIKTAGVCHGDMTCPPANWWQKLRRSSKKYSRESDEDRTCHTDCFGLDTPFIPQKAGDWCHFSRNP